MPRTIHLLAAGIFVMVTSEFAVAGMMPQMAAGLAVTVPQIGFLITAFALAMAAGGPFLTMALTRFRPRTALAGLFVVFAAGNVLGALAWTYPVMMGARILTGVTAQAFFGTAVALGMRLVRPEIRGRAVAVVLNGLMVGTLLGLPIAGFIGERFGWRAAFWAISVLTGVVAAVTLAGLPDLDRAVVAGTAGDPRAILRTGKLWRTLPTSTLIIGATFAAFSYATPILTEVTGFAAATVPLILLAYGAATVIGNMVVGRLADRHPIGVQLVGLGLNVVFLTGFALLAEQAAPAVGLLLGIGAVGVTMNAAMALRVQRAAGDSGPLVSTIHGSFITAGVMIGSFGGALAIDAVGLRGPLWLGAALALAGLATLLPDALRLPGCPAAAPTP